MKRIALLLLLLFGLGCASQPQPVEPPPVPDVSHDEEALRQVVDPYATILMGFARDEMASALYVAGTGVVIDDGVAITCAHNVPQDHMGKTFILWQASDGSPKKVIPAIVRKIDRKVDIAEVIFQGSRVPHKTPLAQTYQPDPDGLSTVRLFKRTRPVIFSPVRHVEGVHGVWNDGEMVGVFPRGWSQDICIPGDSGSPVYNSRGEVVGLLNASGGGQDFCLVPVEWIRSFLKRG